MANQTPDQIFDLNFGRTLAFATKAHGSQVRRYTGEPYMNHCRAVAEMVLQYENHVIPVHAAICHDLCEDANVTADDLRAEFGDEITALVLEVTDVSRPSDGNRAVRKALDREHLAKASPWGKTIKLADLIDNTASIVAHDPKFAKVYLAEKRLLMPVLVGGNEHLYARAMRSLEAASINGPRL